MKFMHISLLVVFSVFMSMSVAQGQGDLSVSGTTTTNALILSGLDCTANANGGALTADGSGVVSCSDDDGGGSGNTLDAAYDQSGAGAGRTITADAGAVVIEGTGGLVLDGNDLDQLPGDPILTGSLAIGASPRSVYVSGRYASLSDMQTMQHCAFRINGMQMSIRYFWPGV